MSITRREALTHATFGSTAALLTPFLHSVAAHAAGDSERLPKRFVFIMKASGIDKFNLAPESVASDGDVTSAYAEKRDKLVQVSLLDKALPAMLQPLEPFKKQLTIVQGLSGNNFKGNHTAGYGALSCHNSELSPIAPTVDALLGLKHSTGPYPMFGMATNGTLRGQASVPDDAYVYPNLSAYKSGQGVPFQASPTKAFNELFGSAVMSDADLQKKSAIHRNLMDFLKDDAQRINRRLSPDDRERFAGYVDTFDSLRLRHDRKSALKGSIKKSAPEYIEDKYNSMTHMDRMECQFDLGTAALVAGLTNVITLRPDTLGALYQGLGTGSLGLHQIGHGAGTGNMTSPQIRRKVVNYHMGLIAKMAARFASIPEGDGTMLDNTLIVYTSCAGGKHHGGNTDWPFLLVGGLGDKLKMGQYLQYPSYQNAGHRTISNLYMSLMDVAGVKYGEHFGQFDPALRDIDVRGPLPEIIA